MKTVKLTDDELRTLIWMAQNQYATKVKECLQLGVKPSEHSTIQKVLSISKKAQAALFDE